MASNNNVGRGGARVAIAYVGSGGVNQKKDQDALFIEMREDSKERETRPGWLGLKALGVLKSLPETSKDVVDTHLVSLHSN